MGVPQSNPLQPPLHLSPVRDLQGTGFSCRGWPGDKANRLSVLRLLQAAWKATAPGSTQGPQRQRRSRNPRRVWEQTGLCTSLCQGSCRHPKHRSKLSLLLREPAAEANHTATRVEIIFQQAGTTCVVPPVLGQHLEDGGGPSPQKVPSIWGQQSCCQTHPKSSAPQACSLPAHSHLL